MLVYAVRMRFDLEFPLFTLFGSAARETVKQNRKKKNKLNELYRKAQSSMCTDKKVKIQDSKA